MIEDKSLVPQPQSQKLGSRSLEVTRIYLHKGESVTRSLWVNVNTRHLLLKLLMAPFVITAGLAMFILVMIAVIITLVALAIIWSVRKPRGRKSGV